METTLSISGCHRDVIRCVKSSLCNKALWDVPRFLLGGQAMECTLVRLEACLYTQTTSKTQYPSSHKHINSETQRGQEGKEVSVDMWFTLLLVCCVPTWNILTPVTILDLIDYVTWLINVYGMSMNGEDSLFVWKVTVREKGNRVYDPGLLSKMNRSLINIMEKWLLPDCTPPRRQQHNSWAIMGNRW